MSFHDSRRQAVAAAAISTGSATAASTIITSLTTSKTVIHSGDRDDAGRHDRRERIRLHGVTITSADMITGRFSGSADTPIAVRACLPCSPNTSSRRSDAGLSTAVVCG